MAIKGQNLRVFVGGQCVAAATSCQLHVSAGTEDSSTKDTASGWDESTVTTKSWDISCDALVTLTDPVSGGTGKTTVDIIGLIGTSVQVFFDQTSGANNRTAGTAAIKKSGTAIVEDVSINAANRQNASYTVKFKGTGALS